MSTISQSYVPSAPPAPLPVSNAGSAAPAAPTAQVAPSTTTALSTQENVSSNPSASIDVTNSQGHAARMALGSDYTHGGTGGGQANTSGRVNNYDTKLATNNSERLDPSSKESRARDLKGFSQRDNDKYGTLNDDQRCAGTALTANIYHAEGTAGLTKLMDACEKYHAANKRDALSEEGPDFSAIREKIKNNQPLTKGDLSLISEGVHTTLRDAQHIGETKNGLPHLDKGVSPGAMKDFLSSDSAKDVKAVMANSGNTLLPIDMDGNGSFDHWVANLKGSGVYDPESVRGKDGKLSQITSDPEMIKRYAAAYDRAEADVKKR